MPFWTFFIGFLMRSSARRIVLTFHWTASAASLPFSSFQVRKIRAFLPFEVGTDCDRFRFALCPCAGLQVFCGVAFLFSFFRPFDLR